MTEKLELNIDPKNVKLKVEERSRGRMKIQIKLNREEATSFKNFVEQLKPEQLSFDEFSKAIFFSGLQAMGDKLQETTIEYVKENREQLEASGMDVEGFFNELNSVEQVDG
tara:strand:- start:1184 stop:1516 length:333 start_codon:yes stop_codon:yes gene_type:complete